MPIESIAHPTDLTAASELAFAHALRIAFATKAELTIVHVDQGGAHTSGSDLPQVRRTLARWGIRAGGTAAEPDPHAGLHVRKVNYRGGDPTEAILAQLERRPADLVVLATHRREGMARWLHREVATPVARRAGTTTLFVADGVKGFVTPEEGWVTLRRILVPIDRAPSPRAAVEAAALLARTFGGKVGFTLLHVGTAGERPVVDPPEDPAWTWDRVLRQGNVVDEILDVARRTSADLIVVATQGHAGILDALRGSTTERVLRGSPCPVLAVPAAA